MVPNPLSSLPAVLPGGRQAKGKGDARSRASTEGTGFVGGGDPLFHCRFTGYRAASVARVRRSDQGSVQNDPWAGKERPDSSRRGRRGFFLPSTKSPRTGATRSSFPPVFPFAHRQMPPSATPPHSRKSDALAFLTPLIHRDCCFPSARAARPALPWLKVRATEPCGSHCLTYGTLDLKRSEIERMRR